MIGGSLEYLLPGEHRILRFAPPVVARFRMHRQSRPWRFEAGGQLFATMTDTLIDVVEATGPRPTDKRSLFGYIPDRDAERAEIKERYARGLHFVGDWHTHRQRWPNPSGRDTESMRDMFSRSEHSLSGFVLVVVGTAQFPAGLHVSFHQSRDWHQLQPSCPSMPAPAHADGEML
jgi:integrative and conjugative element protein (TIGR02256 family)